MARSSSLKAKFLSALLAAGRWRLFSSIFQCLFKPMNHLLPVDRLAENADWFAFFHPQPDYPLHILILPKEGIPTLSKAPDDQLALYASLFDLVKVLLLRFDLESAGYRLITNGGPNQTIPQWHWHLVSEGWEAKDA
jgi:histidine triad (HIT) family protein